MQPLIGGEVACHQDARFLYTEPLTVTGFWFAIEDATLQNGCLWTKPGSHRTTLRKLFKRAGASDAANSDGDRTIFEELDPAPLPSPSELVPLEVPAGTMVILNGLLPHWSDINRSPTSRHAYSLHCISAAAEYPDWNWLRRSPDMPLRSLAEVAGVAA
jgi:phytanoyl-CoA hydroxylase